MTNQKGFTIVEGVLIVAVLSIIGLGGWRIANRNNADTQLSIDTNEVAQEIEQLPSDLSGLKTVEEIEKIAGVSETVSMTGFKLEPKDGRYEYIVKLSDGRKLIINAATGEIIKEEKTDVSEDFSNQDVSISMTEAYAIAAARSSSPIKDIELELEDKKATYKIEYSDGSKIEINAINGAIVKSEIKGNSSDDDINSGSDSSPDNEQEDSSTEENEQKQEDEEDSSDNEDSDDSVDNEDHSEEDR